MSPPATITLTRIAPRTWDFDNLVTGFKSVRDQIASLIYPDKKIGHGDEEGGALTFVYEQKKGAPKEYAIEIKVDCYHPIDPHIKNNLSDYSQKPLNCS